MYSPGGIQVRSLSPRGSNSLPSAMPPLILPYKPIVQSIILDELEKAYIIKGVGPIGSTISAVDYDIQAEVNNYGLFQIDIPVIQVDLLATTISIIMKSDGLISDPILIDIPTVDQEILDISILVSGDEGVLLVLLKNPDESSANLVGDGVIYSFEAVQSTWEYQYIRDPDHPDISDQKFHIFVDHVNRGYVQIPSVITTDIPESLSKASLGSSWIIQVTVTPQLFPQLVVLQLTDTNTGLIKYYASSSFTLFVSNEDTISVIIPAADIEITSYSVITTVTGGNYLCVAHNDVQIT